MTVARRHIIARLGDRIVYDLQTECWNWTGGTACGYGKISAGGRGEGSRMTHRVTYEHFVGPIPDGLQIDHLCRNRLCCNPKHLELVTPRENTHRAPRGMAVLNAAKTECVNGHPFSEDNTFIDEGGWRQCKTCRRERVARYRARRAS